MFICLNILIGQVDYQTQIQTIFNSNCTSCHVDGGAYYGGLDLSTYNNVMSGGNSGAVIVPNDHANSYLWQRVNNGEMPPGNNPDLTASQVSLVALWIDEGALENPSIVQKTYVPDDNFEQALIDLGYDDVLNDSVLTANISGVTTLNVSNDSISDLTGIEGFTALDTLDCSSNQLTALDVSSNTSLTNLNCGGNELTSLDVSNNTDLTTLHCNNNQLTSLDVSNNTALTDLRCGSNELTSLDVSNNTALNSLFCYHNSIDSLDVSSNTALTAFHCGNNQLTSLDVSANTSLSSLTCWNNQLTSLDVSNNTFLTSLGCQQNELTSLDVSNNTFLNQLYCYNTSIDSLDLSSNTALTLLYCQDNELTYLNMRNGITDALTIFNATNNSLTCIETLDPDYATANWTNANGNIDEGVTFAVDCSAVSINAEIIPLKFQLYNAYPNPFNPIATLRYDLPENSLVNITIYDMLGRQVKTLIHQTQDAGYKSVIWDATNDYGKPVSAGIYLYQIQAGEYISTKKMVLLK